jgi:hypothetical protein
MGVAAVIYAKKSVFSVAVVLTIAGGILLNSADASRPASDDGLLCVIDVLVQSKNTSGIVTGSEIYQREFVLSEDETFSEDFSTQTRFKFFDASFQKVDGDKVVAIDWFADVTVFNSVDFTTSVILSKGDKSGRAAGSHTLYTSSGSTTTTYTLTCVKN